MEDKQKGKKSKEENKKIKKQKNKKNQNENIKQNNINDFIFYDENADEIKSEINAFSVLNIFLIMILVATCTYFLTRRSVEKEFLNSTSLDEKIEYKIKEIQSVIEQNYSGEIDEDAILSSTLKGYVDGLGDKYSSYYTQEEYQRLLEDLKGDYSGVGIIISKNSNDEVVVVGVMENGPANKVGVLAGDIIVAVDNVRLSQADTEKVTDSIRGKQGTTVDITVKRDEKEIPFSIVRENIETTEVTSEKVDDTIGYIKYEAFDEKSTQNFRDKATELKQNGMTKLIIDLRDNGGGTLSSAKEMAGMILPENSTLLYQVDKNGNETKELTTRTPFLDDVEIVVLVNESSASASEVLTSALMDYDKVTVVRTKTYGKGVVQEIIPLKSGDAVKLTISEYLTPKKNHINNIGITPDVVIENTATADKQLEKAIEILK